MGRSIILTLCKYYDNLHHLWERPGSERKIGLLLLWVYLLVLAIVELNRLDWYPRWLPEPPRSHFYSIQFAFTLILGLEVIDLIFILPSSLSSSMGKQLEILTLILLRNAFKELSLLPEPVNIGMDSLGPVINIAVAGLGAFCVFLCLGVYRRIMRRQSFFRESELLQKFVISKKILAIFLLIAFIWIGIYDIYLFIEGISSEFFETIYTVLIFADIAMVLIAQCYMPCYYAVFRNSGYVIGTLMMRLSLSAPPLLCSALAVFAGLYVVMLTWGTNLFSPE